MRSLARIKILRTQPEAEPAGYGERTRPTPGLAVGKEMVSGTFFRHILAKTWKPKRHMNIKEEL